MFTNKVRKLFEKLKVDKEAKVKSIKKNKVAKKTGSLPLPDDVLGKIFDYSSPFDVAKWRTVNRQFNRVAVNRDKAVLYLDVLRLDIHTIVQKGQISDGDFFKHPTAQILAHYEKRSVLLAAHSHWSPYDADRILKAIRYFGRYAKTVSLDASLAELCVAGQCSSDIAHWFQFQTMAGTSDPTAPVLAGGLVPGWLPSSSRATDPLKTSDEEMPRWNPRTQRIPLGPLFPKASEISFRASRPQLRRLRRLEVYNASASTIFCTENLQLFRLTIIGGRTPGALKIKPFLEWLGAKDLGGKYCVQFC